MHIYIITFILSFALTYIVRKIAIKKSIIDTPNERSSHTVPTPRGGGLAIAITWFIGLIYLFINNRIESNLFYALLSGIILVIISFLDDIYNLNPKIRIIAQLISASLALYFLGGMKIIDIGFYKLENIWLLTPVALIGIIWFINLYNFLDGIDGYAGMEAIFISLAFYFFSNHSFYLLLTFSVLGFLVWNWQPAKIFMGDVGSTLLGFNFAVLAIYEQNTLSVSIIIFLIISSIFWFDATYTLFRRWKNKEKLSQAHRKHAYQRIVQAGFSHQKTVFFATFLNIINFVFAYMSFQNKNLCTVYFIFTLIIVFGITYLIDKKKSF